LPLQSLVTIPAQVHQFVISPRTFRLQTASARILQVLNANTSQSPQFEL